MDQPGDVAQSSGRLDERMHVLARGHVDRRDARFVSGVTQDLCRRIGVLLAHVGQQDVLIDADPARDRLADLTGSDDNDYIAHSYSLLRKIAPQLVRLVCRWDDGDKRSIHRTGRHTKLWHARESSNRGRSMGSYSPYCVEEEFCELRHHGGLGRSPPARKSHERAKITHLREVLGRWRLLGLLRW